MKRILAGFVVSSLGWSGVALAQQAAVVPGEYIVKLKSQSAALQQNARAKLAAKSSMKAAYPSMGMYHVSLKTAANPAANLEDIKADPDVEYVEPNYIYSTNQVEGQSSNTAQGYDLGTLLSYKWVSNGKNSFSQFGTTSAANTQLTQAWALSTALDENSDKVVVAVIDSGIDRSHIVFLP
ncbi:MAG: hypothetical protein J7501_18225, partial [Bdellovibrio sp.]|nr:hypothetical protein [Bdellovibrio sp.]